MDGMELFAWIGEDDSGDFGIKVVVTQNGLIGLVATRREAIAGAIPILQEKANELGRPMRLCRYVFAEELEVPEPAKQDGG